MPLAALDTQHIDAVEIIAAPFRHRSFISAIVLEQISGQLVELLVFPADQYRRIAVLRLPKYRLQFADLIIAEARIDRHLKTDGGRLHRRQRSVIGIGNAAILLFLGRIGRENGIGLAEIFCNDGRQFQGTIEPTTAELSHATFGLFSMPDEDDRFSRCCRRSTGCRCAKQAGKNSEEYFAHDAVSENHSG